MRLAASSLPDLGSVATGVIKMRIRAEIVLVLSEEAIAWGTIGST